MVRTAFSLSAIGLAVALTASLHGCDGSVVGTGGNGGGTTTNPNGCPASEPKVGAACSYLSTCTYGPAECPTVYSCENDAWNIAPPLCTPTCPVSTPIQGDACPLDDLHCEYDPDPGCAEAFTMAECIDGVWNVSQVGPACVGTCAQPTPTLGWGCSSCCLPQGCKYFDAVGCVVEISCTGVWTAGPATCPAPSPCAKHNQQSDCIADASCRWLVGSTCGDEYGAPYPFPQGCYPTADCTVDADCPAGTSCKDVDVDPCPGADCASCKVGVRICVP